MPRGREIQHDPEELRRRYEKRRGLLKALAANLERSLVEQLRGVDHIDRISFRVKGTSSYLNKVLGHEPPYRAPLVEVEDQVGGRVLVFFLSGVEIVRQRIHQVFRPVEGEYRRPPQHTLFQHAYAEPQHDVAYKPAEQLTDDDRRELAWVAASAWGADQALERVRARLCPALPEQR